MKKVIKGLALSLLATSFMTGAVSAQASVSNTGPDSTVTITSSQSCNVVVNNNTNIGVVNNNNQSAGSGNATNSTNTNGGGASTGSSSNSNSTSVSFNVIDTVPTSAGNGSSCPIVAAAPTPVTPTTPTAPTPIRPAGGSGAVLGSRTVAAASTIAALPNTGTNNTAALISIATMLVGGIAVASQLAVRGYKNSL